jgi:hypothetical protein
MVLNKTVGRILCLNVDGAPQFTVHYDMPMTLREAELFTEHGIYCQNRQDAQKHWVYKYVRPLGLRPTDDYLSDYRYPSDANWDGPKPEKPTATWDDVDLLFMDILAHPPILPRDVQYLYGLTHAAFHKLPRPEMCPEVPLAVPLVEVISDAPGPSVLVLPPAPARIPRSDDQWFDGDGGLRDPE